MNKSITKHHRFPYEAMINYKEKLLSNIIKKRPEFQNSFTIVEFQNGRDPWQSPVLVNVHVHYVQR